MIALLLPHTGAHAAPSSFFRRLVAAWRRKPSAPEAPLPSGAATALLGSPVLGDRMIADVRREWSARYDGLTDEEIAALTPRKSLPRADGEVVIDQRERVHLVPAGCPWPRAQKPAQAAPPEPARADDTRVDLRIARPYAPPATEGERLAGVMLP